MALFTVYKMVTWLFPRTNQTHHHDHSVTICFPELCNCPVLHRQEIFMPSALSPRQTLEKIWKRQEVQTPWSALRYWPGHWYENALKKHYWLRWQGDLFNSLQIRTFEANFLGTRTIFSTKSENMKAMSTSNWREFGVHPILGSVSQTVSTGRIAGTWSNHILFPAVDMGHLVLQLLNTGLSVEVLA